MDRTGSGNRSCMPSIYLKVTNPALHIYLYLIQQPLLVRHLDAKRPKVLNSDISATLSMAESRSTDRDDAIPYLTLNVHNGPYGCAHTGYIGGACTG